MSKFDKVKTMVEKVKGKYKEMESSPAGKSASKAIDLVSGIGGGMKVAGTATERFAGKLASKANLIGEDAGGVVSKANKAKRATMNEEAPIKRVRNEVEKSNKGTVKTKFSDANPREVYKLRKADEIVTKAKKQYYKEGGK
jgi:hypothetical protein